MGITKTTQKYMMLNGFAVLVICFIIAGCGRAVILKPITAQDIYLNGNDYCFSPDYLREVLRVKIDEGVR